MKNLKKFFKGKKILITGHTGFKGSWMSLVLYHFGSKVYGYSLKPPTAPNNYSILKIKNSIKESKIGDIRDFNKLNRYINKVKPEIIFHMAAQSLVKKSYTKAIDTLNTNIIGTSNILEISKNLSSLRSLVIITSDKCYKNLEKKTGYREEDILGGSDPYSASKACAENIIYSYEKSFFKNKNKVGLASVRAGNVIGGGDWSEDRVIPDTIRSIAKKKRIILRSPNSVRPWQHVLDPINGYLILAKQLYLNPKHYSGPWNFGPHLIKKYNVKKLVQKLLNFMNVNKKIFIKKNLKLKETNLLILNCNKSIKKLNWKINWDVQKSILMTAKWYSCYINEKNKIKILSLNQINEFFK